MTGGSSDPHPRCPEHGPLYGSRVGMTESEVVAEHRGHFAMHEGLLEQTAAEASPHVCRECAEGKHPACDGTAWNHETDEATPCGCPEHGETP